MNLMLQQLTKITQETTQTKGELLTTRTQLAQNIDELAETKTHLVSISQETTQTKGELLTTRKQLAQTEEELTKTREELTITRESLAKTEELLAQNIENFTDTKTQLVKITQDTEESYIELDRINMVLDVKMIQLDTTTSAARFASQEVLQHRLEMDRNRKRIEDMSDRLNTVDMGHRENIDYNLRRIESTDSKVSFLCLALFLTILFDLLVYTVGPTPVIIIVIAIALHNRSNLRDELYRFIGE